ncbi:MAG: malonyl CoA-acyl carrier protein transacylase [Anaerocolumna sp.]|jgi:[acyl-carrier-protein] S-malonyltransferase|nr:malonyl CoA-acyl carrier protein transacylase [Anaerocolumna sp.]
MNNIVLLFPGQGSQYVGMGKDLYNQNYIVRQVFDEASDSLKMDMKKLCFESSINELIKTENAQPAILTTSYAAYSAFMNEEGIQPAFMAGHSLGEITALTCAGGIKFSDAIKIVKLRGKFMQEAVVAGTGCMTAVHGLDAATIERECIRNSTNSEVVSISNYNSENQIVISGHAWAVSAVEESLKELGAVLTRIKVSAPFHCSLMQPVVIKLREELEKYEYSNINYPVISNVSAKPYVSCEDIIENLTRQIISPVRWQETMEYIYNKGVTLAVEMSPGTVLINLIKKSRINIKSYSYEGDSKTLKNILIQTKQTNQITNGSTVLTSCMAIAVCTKNFNWNKDDYQKGVIEPYDKIQQQQDKLDEKGEKPSKKQMLEALEMLKSVFITKRTPVEEQLERFHQIFEETGTKELFVDFKIP